MARVILGLILAALWATSLAAAPQKSPDIAYGRDQLQTFDVYWDDATRNAPVIVMLHGGAWDFGDKTNRAVWRQKSRHWVPRGYVFVSVNTRLLPTPPGQQAVDFARAVALIQKSAARWGGDGSRVILMGHSAGAHIAALVAGDRSFQIRHDMKPVRGAVILDTAALDLETLMAGNPSRMHRKAFGDDPAYWRQQSPAARLGRGGAPMLAVCSSRRREVCPMARDFAQGAARLAVPVTVLPVPLRHGPLNRDLGKPSRYTEIVTRWIAERVR
ncbi:MAG: alpha/beta hydrolase [Silicimonas sp.]|nr:alpha/beta hydrolase [Silicimonas sp.]